jgi:hypothetical protein
VKVFPREYKRALREWAEKKSPSAASGAAVSVGTKSNG